MAPLLLGENPGYRRMCFSWRRSHRSRFVLKVTQTKQQVPCSRRYVKCTHVLGFHGQGAIPKVSRVSKHKSDLENLRMFSKEH